MEISDSFEIRVLFTYIFAGFYLNDKCCRISGNFFTACSEQEWLPLRIIVTKLRRLFNGFI